MTRPEMETLFAQRHQAFVQRDPERIGTFYTPDAVVESPIAGGAVRGREANVDVLWKFFTAFPDVMFVMEELLIDGTRAAERLTISGTDVGGFLGLPPTHKPFHLPMISLCSVRDGLIASEQRIYDFTGMLVQIGVLRAKPA
jgi:steroid delta-isomerase-like uncharacterized protein